MNRFCQSILLTLVFGTSLCGALEAQTGGHTLFGDLKVDESQVSGIKPISFDIILYTETGIMVGRQMVSSSGRYRFMNLLNGNYDVVVEVENREVARLRVFLASAFKNDFRQDIALQWHPNQANFKREKVNVVSAADAYIRPATNANLFEKAARAMETKHYGRAIDLLRQIVETDPNDFLSWTELGTAYLLEKNWAEAEKAYMRAVELRPKFFLALLNLGRLRIAEKNYESAITALALAVEVKPSSATANYYLGEAYLQIKKGSQAVGYLYEALRLDPTGMAEAHLRLAALYNGAGLKEKAAAEYEAFLKKKPDYPDRKKLEQYIAANKK